MISTASVFAPFVCASILGRTVLILSRIWHGKIHVKFFLLSRHYTTANWEILKGASARRLFAAFPHLKRRLWGGHLWNPSYYVGTAGHVSAETIKRYIEEQKTDADADDQGAGLC